jgi:hypothetical protein
MTRFPARQNFLMVESSCPFCDTSGAADHFAAIPSRIAESHNPGAERERRRERSEARGRWTENITGFLILVVARERSLQ